MLTLSEKARLLSTLSQEQITLWQQAARISQSQHNLHAEYMSNMRKLSAQHERVLARLEDVDTMIAAAYLAA